jgi:hypothetical protein
MFEDEPDYPMSIKLRKLSSRELNRPSIRKLDKQFSSRLTSAERRQWSRAGKALDSDFLREKAEVIIDSVFEIYRGRKHTKNKLLQRNVWSGLDAIAQHFDAAGFAPLFRQAVPRMLRGVSFTDPDVLDAEYALVSGSLGLSEKQASLNCIGRSQFTAVMALTQKLIEKNGFGFLRRKDFSFFSASLAACGRPDRMFTHKMAILPNLWKLFPVVICGVINFVLAGTVLVPILTIIVALAILVFGC